MQRIQNMRGTTLFIGVSVVAFLIDALLGRGLLLWGAKSYAVWAGEWYRLIAANFIHSGVTHLLFNMYALYIFGQIVENLAGRAGFMTVYMVGGIVGFLASLLTNPDSLSVGASAAVFGLMGYTLHFRLRRLPKRWISMDSAFLQILGINVLMGFMVPNIDQSAHLGGLVGGFFVAGVLGLPSANFGPYGPREETPAGERVFAALCLLLFVWIGLAPLSFAQVIGRAAPQIEASMADHYRPYFQPFLVADAAVLWLDPAVSRDWTYVEGPVILPGGGRVAFAAFWRWERGGGKVVPVPYRVLWERRRNNREWETVQVDQGVANQVDPQRGRIFRRSVLSLPSVREGAGEWRVQVVMDGSVHFNREFRLNATDPV